MKRKFVKVMFFGALALSTVTYVGCKTTMMTLTICKHRLMLIRLASLICRNL